jgi:hypothetical protein
LRPYLRGRVVHDLGAGNLALANVLLDHGAKRVIAIDEKQPRPPNDNARIEFVRTKFENYKANIRTAFVSWPTNTVYWPDHNTQPALVHLISCASRIIYLGKNTSGVLCGTPALYRFLSKREVLEHWPEDANTLVVYGPTSVDSIDRPLLLVERAGIDHTRVYHSDFT